MGKRRKFSEEFKREAVARASRPIQYATALITGPGSPRRSAAGRANFQSGVRGWTGNKYERKCWAKTSDRRSPRRTSVLFQKFHLELIEVFRSRSSQSRMEGRRWGREDDHAQR